jgi:hypothetical protein
VNILPSIKRAKFPIIIIIVVVVGGGGESSSSSSSSSSSRSGGSEYYKYNRVGYYVVQSLVASIFRV